MSNPISQDDNGFPIPYLRMTREYMDSENTFDVSVESPFVRRLPKGEKGILVLQTRLFDLMMDKGVDMAVVDCLCGFFGVEACGGSDKSAIIEAWTRICSAAPLMSHFIPHQLADDERIKRMVTLFKFGGVKWSRKDAVLCCRATMIALGFDRIECRIEIRNEYDDQSFSPMSRQVFFLMKPTDMVGFRGLEICEDEHYEGDHSILSVIDCFRDRLIKSHNESREVEDFCYRESWVYDIAADEAKRRDLAVGASLGR